MVHHTITMGGKRVVAFSIIIFSFPHSNTSVFVAVLCLTDAAARTIGDDVCTLGSIDGGGTLP